MLDRTLLKLPPKIDPVKITPLSYYGQREAIVPDLFKLLGNRKYKSFYDPFAGSSSISFAAMAIKLAQDYFINDSCDSFEHLWNMINFIPLELINGYRDYVLGYCQSLAEKRKEFYNQRLIEYNEANKYSNFLKAAILFAFLINFAHRNMPLYDNNLQLVSQGNLEINVKNEEQKLIDFEKKVKHLNSLLCDNRIIFSSGSFVKCLQFANKGDLVILDPPFPSQPANVYLKTEKGDELKNNLKKSLKELVRREVDFIILYGARVVALADQLNEKELNLQHLLRLSTHGLYGDYLEHLYVSPNIKLTNEDLPAGIVFYNELFEHGVEVSNSQYEQAVARLRELKQQKLQVHSTLQARM